MAPIHDRMPVILGRRDWDAWLDPETGNPLLLQSMLAPCPDEWLECSPACSVNTKKDAGTTAILVGIRKVLSLQHISDKSQGDRSPCPRPA
jgi:putative SOS response-associated peptidase YedK